MSDILSIRLRAGEKAQFERAAAAAQETVAEYVRNAVRQRASSRERSGWDKHLGSVVIDVPPPTNANVRKAMSRHRSKA